MLSLFFHTWERRLADVSKDRIVRPFEWGLDWMPPDRQPAPPGEELDAVREYVPRVLADTDTWFTPPPDRRLRRSSGPDDGTSRSRSRRRGPRRTARTTPSSRGSSPRAERGPGGPRRAVLVLPQWNSDGDGHVGPVPAARALRHQRAAAEPALSRSPHAARALSAPTTSSARTSCARWRCAGRRCSTRGARSRGWRGRATSRIGILGTSLGSCLSMLTACHEPLIRAQALNHISPYFADVVWRGLSTAARARRPRRPHRRGHAARAVDAHQPAAVPRQAEGAARSRRCWSTRGTT